jgi:hypothetical protein
MLINTIITYLFTVAVLTASANGVEFAYEDDIIHAVGKNGLSNYKFAKLLTGCSDGNAFRCDRVWRAAILLH